MTGDAAAGLLVIRRLHRLVRHGFRPWLGYDAASGLDRHIHLRRRAARATLHPDGALVFEAPIDAAGTTVIAADDHRGFDARWPPGAPNQRNLTRRLYEIGL